MMNTGQTDDLVRQHQHQNQHQQPHHVAIKAEPLAAEYVDFHQIFGDSGAGSAAAAFHEQVCRATAVRPAIAWSCSSDVSVYLYHSCNRKRQFVVVSGHEGRKQKVV